MLRKLFSATLYSILFFGTVSFISVMVSLLASVGNPRLKPVTNMGFPFRYYYQFWLSGSDSPNCGWNVQHFVADCLTTWILTVIIYLFLKRAK